MTGNIALSALLFGVMFAVVIILMVLSKHDAEEAEERRKRMQRILDGEDPDKPPERF